MFIGFEAKLMISSLEYKTRIFETVDQYDVPKFKCACENEGAFFCGAMPIPLRDCSGIPITWKYVVIYQHTEEITLNEINSGYIAKSFKVFNIDVDGIEFT